MSPGDTPAVPTPLRAGLLTADGYPFRRDALGDWCRTLVEDLAHVTFDLLTVVDREPPTAPAYPLPGHVASARAMVVAPESERTGGGQDRDAVAAAVLMCRGLLSEPAQADQMFAAGLRRLALLPESSLVDVPLGEVLVDAWRSGRAMESDQRQPLPRLGLHDPRAAATLLRHAVQVLSAPVGAADLLHCVGGSTPLLAALGARWRTGTPLLLTEAADGRSRPAEDRLSPAVRTVLSRFRRSVVRTGYAEAGLIGPLSAYQYAASYTDLAGPPPVPTFELTLSVPAPRTPIPATVRWLTREDR
jgi:hypothetical protein